jgi:hypothetical protein
MANCGGAERRLRMLPRVLIDSRDKSLEARARMAGFGFAMLSTYATFRMSSKEWVPHGCRTAAALPPALSFKFTVGPLSSAFQSFGSVRPSLSSSRAESPLWQPTITGCG